MKKLIIFIVAFTLCISLGLAPFYSRGYLTDLGNITVDLVLSLIVIFSMSVGMGLLATTLED